MTINTGEFGWHEWWAACRRILVNDHGIDPGRLMRRASILYALGWDARRAARTLGGYRE